MSKRSNNHFKRRSYSAKKVKTYQPKEFIRFEDHIEKLETAEKKRLQNKEKKKTKEDVEKFKDYYPVIPSTILKLYNHEDTTKELDPILNLSNRQQDERTRGTTMTFAELVSYFFDDDILDALIEHNVNHSQLLPRVLYGNNQGKLHLFLFFT